MIIDKLYKRVEKLGHVCLGLDTDLSYIPEEILKESSSNREAIVKFNKGIIDATLDVVSTYKVQIAYYEALGIEGLMAYKETLEYLREKDAIIIADIKRGDIAKTAEMYAKAHFTGDFEADFITLNPYMGADSITPFIDVCKEEKKGLFILVKTSNPSSGDFQDQMVGDRPVYELVGEKVAQWGETCMGDDYSYVGAVVGATYPEMGKTLRKIMPKAYILVPGYGAQGGQGKDLVHFFNEDGLGAIVNSSRGIIAAYKQEKYAKFGEENFADASRAAAEDMIADITGALEAAK